MLSSVISSCVHKRVRLILWMAPDAITVPEMAGADLFIDIRKYAGRQVVLTDGEVYGATNDGAMVRAGQTLLVLQP